MTTGADGLVSDRHGALAWRTGVRARPARRRPRAARPPGLVGGRESGAEAPRSLVFTDRSLYRPGQTLHWKVLAFDGRADQGRLALLPGTPVTVALIDPNGERVAEQVSTTNAFGSRSGEFVIPAGRLLGDWRLEVTPSGSASIGVEEYKRPTFEVTLERPSEEPRLNRPAKLAGEARYYFGLPVASGRVAWRVERDRPAPLVAALGLGLRDRRAAPPDRLGHHHARRRRRLRGRLHPRGRRTGEEVGRDLSLSHDRGDHRRRRRDPQRRARAPLGLGRRRDEARRRFRLPARRAAGRARARAHRPRRRPARRRRALAAARDRPTLDRAAARGGAGDEAARPRPTSASGPRAIACARAGRPRRRSARCSPASPTAASSPRGSVQPRRRRPRHPRARPSGARRLPPPLRDAGPLRRTLRDGDRLRGRRRDDAARRGARAPLRERPGAPRRHGAALGALGALGPDASSSSACAAKSSRSGGRSRPAATASGSRSR